MRLTPVLRLRPGRVAPAVVVTAILVAGGCSSGGGTPIGPSTSAGPALSSTAPTLSGKVSVVATGLEVPWGVAFLPDGTALVSERISHKIVRVSPDGAKSVVGTVPGVAGDAGEGGLLGLALSPKFATDHLVYAYISTASDNRVVRFTYTRAGLGKPEAVFTGIPVAANHDGGRIAFGPADGLLYVTTGDAGKPARAPDPSYLGGKVLRMTPDGAPAPGNPDPASVVWTVGHRNPQGLAFAPDGTIYEAELGQNSQDEINELSGGKDYGWPSVEGTKGNASGKTAPLVTFSTSQASPSGLDYANGSLWLATLQGQRLYQIRVNGGGKLATPTSMLVGEFGRLRTVVTAPDGSLWVTTSNRDGRGHPVAGDDRIIRVQLS